MLCVLPNPMPQDNVDPLHAVKWHPQQPDLVAVASSTNLYLINISDAAAVFGGKPIPQSELHRVGQVFSVPSVSTREVPATCFPSHMYYSLLWRLTSMFRGMRLRRSLRIRP